VGLAQVFGDFGAVLSWCATLVHRCPSGEGAKWIGLAGEPRSPASDPVGPFTSRTFPARNSEDQIPAFDSLIFLASLEDILRELLELGLVFGICSVLLWGVECGLLDLVFGRRGTV